MEVRMIHITPGMTYEKVKVTKHANVKGYALGKLLQQFEPRIQWDLMGPGTLSGSFHAEVDYDFEDKDGRKHRDRKECNVVDFLRLEFGGIYGNVFDLWNGKKFDDYFKNIEYIKDKVREGDFSVFTEYQFLKDRRGDWFKEDETEEISRTLGIQRADGTQHHRFKNFTPAIMSRIADHVENMLRTELIGDGKMKNVKPIDFDDFSYEDIEEQLSKVWHV